LAEWFGKRGELVEDGVENLPSVSVLIAAYNEEAVIEERLKNALEMDYPRDKLEIVVASDGSTDRTAEIVGRYADRGVRLLDYKPRRGKATVVNSAFPELKGEVVILSDANTHTEPDAARKLVRWFRDPKIGVACGRLILTDSKHGKNADSLYWQYETFLKTQEGRLGALLGVNGAIYAIRKSVYTPIPDDTLIDDLVIPLAAKLRTGCAITYDSEAVAREETAVYVSCEFRRRTRIGAGGFQTIVRLWSLLHPRQGWVAFTFVSHKILRWLGPFFLLSLLVTNLLLWEVPFYQFVLLAQFGFYLVSTFGAWIPPQLRLLKLVRLTTMFTSMNMALLLGFWRWLRGSQRAAWTRTTRRIEVVAPKSAEAVNPKSAWSGSGRLMKASGTIQ
jgi:cellulose synthase/poly-beta-1,6-N-acetylglucosamine synthase-like glycosyltransferase